MNAHTPASHGTGRTGRIPCGYPFSGCCGGSSGPRFLKSAFDAVELSRFVMDGGYIGHAEIRIGDSPLMLWDEYPSRTRIRPSTTAALRRAFGCTSRNADQVVRRAVAAGATLRQPVADQFFGERMGAVVDPFGHTWRIATYVQDIAPEEMKRRVDAWANANPEWRAAGGQ